MKSVFVIVASVVFSAYALEIEQPDLSGNVIMDFVSFSGDSAYASSGYYQIASNRLLVRKVTVGLSGNINPFVEYETELGVASCAGSGLAVSVKEAGVYLTPGALRFGVGMTHVARGFELGTDCGYTLAMEKPMFRLAVSPSCHPLGLIAGTEFSVGNAGSADVQLFYGNGNGGTIKDEYDFNAALFYHTPVQGFTAGGFYNALEMEINPENEGFENGKRYGFGLDYSSSGLMARGEYFQINGLLPGMIVDGCTMAAEDVENTGMIAQAGYLFQLDSESISSVTPYFQYQEWNRFSNADSGDYKYSWIATGVKADVGSSGCYVTAEYKAPSATPEGQSEDSSIIILRLGVDY